MKVFLLMSIVLLSSHVLSGPVLVVGKWSTDCIQTQMTHEQGFAIEAYDIEDSGSYRFVRHWFRDSSCSQEMAQADIETGRVTIGKLISTFFQHSEVYEADFLTQEGMDLGAIKIEGDTLRFARGMKNSTMRNTMVGLFKYKKID